MKEKKKNDGMIQIKRNTQARKMESKVDIPDIGQKNPLETTREIKKLSAQTVKKKTVNMPQN